MQRFFSFAAMVAVAGAVMLPMQTVAQDEPYTSVQRLDLAPEDAEAFLARVKVVADAAREIDLDPKYRWGLYRWDNEILFATWHESLAELEGGEGMIEEFRAAGIEGRVMEAMEATQSYTMNSVENSVVRARPDLGFTPDNPVVTPGEHGGLYAMEMWPKNGHVPAFEESLKGIMALLEEAGGVYPVLVNQDFIGDGGYTVLVVFDNLGNFFGPNALEARLASNPSLAARFQEATAAHGKHLMRSETRIVNYLPMHSYAPLTATSAGN